MQVGKTREKLAKLIDQLMEREFPNDGFYQCDPKDLIVNRGSNVYNDWCSWTGKVRSMSGYQLDKQLSSWDTMTDLVKGGKLGIVGNKNESPIELSKSK